MSTIRTTILCAVTLLSTTSLPAFAQISWDGDRLRPFTIGTNYMSRKGYLRWRSSLGHIEMVRDLTYSPDGKTLASVDLGGTLRIWDIKTKILRQTLKPAWYPLAFAPDSQTLMSSSGQNTKTVTLWDVATGHEKRKITRDYGGDNQWFSWTPDGKSLTIGRQLVEIKRDEITVVPTVTLDNVNNGAIQVISPDGTTLVQQLGAEALYLKDIRTGKILQNLTGDIGYVRDALFSQDGQRLASRGDSSIEIWDLKTGAGISAISTRCRYIQFSPDGLLIASGGESNTVEVWNTQTGELQCSLLGARFPVSFAPDDKKIATGYWALSGEDLPEFLNLIYLWDTGSGKNVDIIPGKWQSH